MSQAVYNSTKTTRANKIGFQRPWFILDASKEPMGRLATKAAKLLTGKYRADFAPDTDMGAMVVIINAQSTVLTGRKAEKKNYFRHEDSRIGSLKVTSFADYMKKNPSKPLYLAIKGMLPKNRHQDLRLNNRLFIFNQGHNITHKLTPAN